MPEIEALLRGASGTLEKALAALPDRAHEVGIDVHVNCVINRPQRRSPRSQHPPLSRPPPYVRHFVWNNLDPRWAGPRSTRLSSSRGWSQFELSARAAMRLLHASRPHLPRREGPAVLHGRVRVGQHRDAQDRQGRGARRPLPRRQADRAPDRLGPPLRPRVPASAACARSAAACSIAAPPTTPPSSRRSSSTPSRSCAPSSTTPATPPSPTAASPPGARSSAATAPPAPPSRPSRARRAAAPPDAPAVGQITVEGVRLYQASPPRRGAQGRRPRRAPGARPRRRRHLTSRHGDSDMAMPAWLTMPMPFRPCPESMSQGLDVSAERAPAPARPQQPEPDQHQRPERARRRAVARAPVIDQLAVPAGGRALAASLPSLPSLPSEPSLSGPPLVGPRSGRRWCRSSSPRPRATACIATGPSRSPSSVDLRRCTPPWRTGPPAPPTDRPRGRRAAPPCRAPHDMSLRTGPSRRWRGCVSRAATQNGFESLKFSDVENSPAAAAPSTTSSRTTSASVAGGRSTCDTSMRMQPRRTRAARAEALAPLDVRAGAAAVERVAVGHRPVAAHEVLEVLAVGDDQVLQDRAFGALSGADGLGLDREAEAELEQVRRAAFVVE